jgi:hypothetical protein
MSRTEFYQQLETMSPKELKKVAIRVDELLSGEPEVDFSEEEWEIIRERIAEYRKDPSRAEDGHVVAARIIANLSSKRG